ncbi:hypothetical protein GUJ93_ZPchr0001g31616 [Zizania palustris]|uniref:PH domain-containing protein n=1 Tax=Zizania palustris TaxID=103762 RepID=A0A8J5RUD3_ZIZPA|nr:hypothetical protein GUJ93_ZPchr0001g31616 [Zizania palustris]KAG8053700.1 hypothetical protein GUJ93_ZPchr0001g31616 [Zizania palustris]
MEFPHHHHHSHRHDDDDEDRRRRPAAYGHEAPPPYGQPVPPPYGQPAPPPYGSHPPPPSYGRQDDYAPPPAYGGGYGNVVHVSHEVPHERPHYGGGGGGSEDFIHPVHETRPHHGGGGGGYGGGGAGSDDFIHPVHETRPHHGGGGGGGSAPPVRQQTYRIFCKAGEDKYSLAVRGGKVCLVRSDRDDDTQHWVKDMKYSTRVKDEEGYPAMALVSKATGEALKHSLGQSHPVRLFFYLVTILIIKDFPL